jgi:tellurite resistance protein TerB
MPINKHSHQEAIVTAQGTQARDTEFLEAMIAACSIIAHADGKVVRGERRKLLSAIDSSGGLARHSREEVLDRLLAHELSFAMDCETAYSFAADSIRPMAARRADALTLIDACRAMVLADGIAEPAEIQALHKIRAILGLDSAFDRSRK